MRLFRGFPIHTNGCSFWPDGNYLSCCEQHDVAYLVGGNWLDRWQADLELAKCVKRSHSSWMAGLMFLGVMVFGVLFFHWRLK